MNTDLQSVRFLLSALSVYKTDDALLSALEDTLTAVCDDSDYSAAVNKFCGFCSILYNTCSGDLKSYINDIIKYSDSEFARACAANDNIPEFILRAAENDIRALNLTSDITSSDIKAYLNEKYPENAERTAALPDFYSTNDKSVGFESAKTFYRAFGFGEYARCKAFSFEQKNGRYVLTPVENPDPIRLCELKQYEMQRTKIVNNTLAFLKGKPYNNVLLYGDRGTGKSSTVKAILNEYSHMGLRLVQIDKENLYGLAELTERLVNVPLKFILFVDDLTFNENDDSFGMLKAVLEGGIVKRPDNIAIYATSNRRHLIKESFTAREGDEIHKADTIDETLSLSDRFGLSLTFIAPAKDKFLEIVRLIADDRGLAVDSDTLYRGAEQFAMRRGGRSPRLAKQYVDDLEARLSLGID